MNIGVSFHVLEDCQRRHYLFIYLFFITKSRFISTPWTVFSTQVRSGKPMFSQFVNIFWLKHAFPYTLHILL